MKRTAGRVAIVGAMALAGCRSGESFEGERSGGSAGAVPASPEDGVVLEARRTYKPKSWTDADVSVAALSFAVPSEIPVTEGAPARRKAKLTFSKGNGAPITCVY